MKKISALLAIAMVFVLLMGLVGCATPEEPAATEAVVENPEVVATEAPAAATEAPAFKVAFIPNQRFGDSGPVDQMASGVDQAVTDFGIEAKKLESIDAAGFEEDIRAMAEEGYNLIITTFGYMQEPMITVAQEYPDTLFAGVYQDTNLGDTKYANIWGTSFQGGATFFLTGYMAGKLTESNVVGFIGGAEEPGPNSEANEFMKGVKAANPEATVEFSLVGGYEDTAKSKEIALAMIAKGADVLQGDAGSADLGMVEAAKESGNVLVFSCVSAYYDVYDLFVGTIPLGFKETVYDAIKMAVEGNFPGGTNGLRDITNMGYYVDWEGIETWLAAHPDYQETLGPAIEEAKAIEAEYMAGTRVDPYDTEFPSWERIQGLD